MSDPPSVLSSLETVSKNAIYSVDHIREDLAQAWAGGGHNTVKRTLEPGQSHTATEINAYSTQASGLGVARAFEYFDHCQAFLWQLSAALESIPDTRTAAMCFDQWDTVRIGASATLYLVLTW